jgi:3'-phosphoadenosine 5'-phosphosulfate sulfotransferase (PAPS reductase)/FAD synthetase
MYHDDLIALNTLPTPHPDAVAALPKADYILVNTSGGKDSEVTLDYVLELADRMGIERSRIVAVHCDLGRVEWAGTPELAERQVARYEGIRFCKVQRQGTVRQATKARPAAVLGDLLDQVWERHESNVSKGKDISPWPTVSNRWCTSDHKNGQVLKLMTALVDEFRAAHGWSKNGRDGRECRIINVMGMRAEESDKRAGMAEWEYDESASNGKRFVWNWLPVKHWTEQQVWDRIWANDLEYHWAYDKGMDRLSCCFCVLASPKDWAIALPFNRDLAESYAEMERRTGHAMVERANGTKVSIQDIIDAADRAGQEEEVLAA